MSSLRNMCVRALRRDGQWRSSSGRAAAGFTLIEVLVATVITLILIGSLAAAFAFVTETVADSRSLVEVNDRIRQARQMIQEDLKNITAHTLPPLDPDHGDGYLEIVEGPIGPIFKATELGGTANVNATVNETGWNLDTTADDRDDVLAFTVRAGEAPYIGLGGETWYAEIVYFFRDEGGTPPQRNLHRIVRILRPGYSPEVSPYYGGTSSVPNNTRYMARWYNTSTDVSWRQEGGRFDNRQMPSQNGAAVVYTGPLVFSNSLGDLTKRENRYGHQPVAYPHDVRHWFRPPFPPTAGNNSLNATNNTTGRRFTAASQSRLLCCYMPTLREYRHQRWIFPLYDPDLPSRQEGSPLGSTVVPDPVYIQPPSPIHPRETVVFPRANTVANFHVSATSTASQMTSLSANSGDPEDVLLTDVLSFDVRVWDPGAPIFSTTAALTGTADSSASASLVTVTPGDPGYPYCLARFIQSPLGANAPVAFGSYVDLNYMGVQFTSTPTAAVPGDLDPYKDPFSAPITNPRTYETALRELESNMGRGTGLPPQLPRPHFAGRGNIRAGAYRFGLPGIDRFENITSACVYDTWSNHYESDGLDQNGDRIVDNMTNGLDDNGINGVDDPTEAEAPPPYPHALRGIRVRIRCMEPDSKQIREVTLTHEFLQE